MFRLLRYFSIMSFVSIAVVTALFAYVGRQRALADLTELAESRNVALTQAFANSLWPDFAPFVSVASGLRREELRQRPEIARLRQAVLAQMRGVDVVKVKVYDRAGLTVFSTEAKQIGEDKSKNAGFRSALAGAVASELTHRDTFSAFEQTIEDRDVFSSYIPIRRDRTGPVEGVFELYYDVTTFLQKTRRAQALTVVTVAVTSLLLYCVLLLVVQRADAIIKRQYRELESRGHQLRQAQKMEAVGHLAGGIAHDFNNLLTVIRGHATLLENQLEREHPLRRHLDPIHRTVDRATSLIQQLLAFSRKQVLQPARLDLNAVVGGFAPVVRRLIGEHIELVTTLGAGAGHIIADQSQLERVILNLAINARDAMPHGGRLTLQTATVELDEAFVQRNPVARVGPHMMLAVQDTGVGMDAATQARLFEPFFTTKEVGKGTGLGLASVYGIVKQSEGYIEVESVVGRGTTFRIYLPNPEPANEPVPLQGVSSAPPREPKPLPEEAPASSQLVLLVEDEKDVRDLLRQTLEMNGYSVRAAGSPREALQFVEESDERIRLLITDVVMPGMSGRALADRLVAAHPMLKVLYVSGYNDEMISRHGVLEEDTNFLPKPFTSDALARKVREVLSTP